MEKGFMLLVLLLLLLKILFRLKEKIISKCHKIVNVKLFDFSMSPEA
jgi:hypothetical protein|nr:MAG TPA: hypothetical protein [Caudoviricetes sp.]